MNLNEFNLTADTQPPPDTLLIAFTPVAKCNETEELRGPTAMAYFDILKGFIYADTPEPLKFLPKYWKESAIFDRISIGRREPIHGNQRGSSECVYDDTTNPFHPGNPVGLTNPASQFSIINCDSGSSFGID